MSAPVTRPRSRTSASWSPWRTVFAFGLVSLAADMVYEGMRAVAGPFLGTLGASALAVGLMTGAGEAMALLGGGHRALADRSARHWRLTILGYAMTAVCVPLLAVAPLVGARARSGGDADRARARGQGDPEPVEVGAPGPRHGIGGPRAGVRRTQGARPGRSLRRPAAGRRGGRRYRREWPAFLVLAVPGAACMLLLFTLSATRPTSCRDRYGRRPGCRRRLAGHEEHRGTTGAARALLRVRHLMALGTSGLMTFGVISYHLVDAGLVETAVVPLVYAAAMAVEAVAALGTGSPTTAGVRASCSRSRSSSSPYRPWPSPAR